jgi:hypothetical protein
VSSIIILLVNFSLKLLETGNIDEPILERNCNIIVFSQKFHDDFLPASLESGGVLELKTEILFVDLRPSEVLLLASCALALDGHLSEEVIFVEDPIGPNGNADHPDRSKPAQPPPVGFLDEVRVVEHQSISINQ